jgi:hypothetical protein
MNVRKFGGVDGGCTLAVDKLGHEHVLVVGKATFDIANDGHCSLSTVQQPLEVADRHHGDPAASSIRYECDFALHKPFTDVVLNASAHAPAGQPVAETVVGFALGSLRKLIRVHGDRVWERSLRGLKVSAAHPFLTMPLRWERAFGGSDRDPSHPDRFVCEVRNLVGTGFFANERSDMAGTPVPNMEHPDHPIVSCVRRSIPIGFGFVSRNWQPRLSHAGTFDAQWQEHQFPFLPEDFDDLYFQSAPEDQRCAHLLGGERVVLVNLTPQGRTEFVVPTFPMSMHLVFRTGHDRLTPRLDTLIIEPDQNRCILVWRASTRLTQKLTDILEVLVGAPTPGRLLAMQREKGYLERVGEAA